MDGLKFISLGGTGNVTKNMFVYEYGNEILLVDCGIGFVDDSMPGVDLMIPDVSYLKKTISATSGGKKIVGMILSHGHEDHIGALPFILPNLPQFPIYASTLTAALANEKLKDFGEGDNVTPVKFGENIQLGQFRVTLVRVTHSILDTAHIFIRTPIGNLYHGSDFKFDFTPVDGKPSDIRQIAKFADEGILCLMSDSLGSERAGHSRSELKITDSFDEEFKKAKGKVFVSTYSSNISRMNQAIEVALKYNRKVCFIGRSFLKARDVGRKLGYMTLPKQMEIMPKDVKRFAPNKVMILVAGSQAQVESGLVRIGTDNDSDIRILKEDTVIFSADPIPGNELNINNLIDTLSKKQARIVHSELTDEFHVSGHGAQNDLKMLISLTNPKFVLPIGGQFRHMVAYRDLAREMGYSDDKVVLNEVSREIIFTENGFRPGKLIETSKVYVDQMSGEAIDSYIIHDRKKISEEGLLIIIAEILPDGRPANVPELVAKGFIYEKMNTLPARLHKELNSQFAKTNTQTINPAYYRKIIQQKAEQILFRERREPFIIPIVVEA